MSLLTAPIETPRKPGVDIRIQQYAGKLYRGGAVGQIFGTGYARPLDITQAGIQFIGVCTETSDNSGGTAGTIVYGAPLSGLSPWANVAREGIWAFAQSGITEASIGLPVFFSDDHTITLTPNNFPAGILVAIDEEKTPLGWVDIGNAVFGRQLGNAPIVQSASGAISPHYSGTYVVTKAGVAALTLAAPTATSEDSITIVITSNTANAHTLTATGLLQTGTASVNVATVAAQAGAGVTLYGYQGKWNVLGSVGITFS